MKKLIQILFVIALPIFIIVSISRLKETIREWRQNYLLTKTVTKIVEFNVEKELRYNATIRRLEDIRKAEFAYKSIYGKYTGSWDTLSDFILNDSFIEIRRKGELTDSMIEAGLNEKKAIQIGLLMRDTLKLKVLGNLFDKDFDTNQLRKIPVEGLNKEFDLKASYIISNSGDNIPVFKVEGHNNNILDGMDEQTIINLNDEMRTNANYPGLKIGSLIEFNNGKGNWEKGYISF